MKIWSQANLTPSMVQKEKSSFWNFFKPLIASEDVCMDWIEFNKKVFSKFLGRVAVVALSVRAICLPLLMSQPLTLVASIVASIVFMYFEWKRLIQKMREVVLEEMNVSFPSSTALWWNLLANQEVLDKISFQGMTLWEEMFIFGNGNPPIDFFTLVAEKVFSVATPLMKEFYLSKIPDAQKATYMAKLRELKLVT